MADTVCAFDPDNMGDKPRNTMARDIRMSRDEAEQVLDVLIQNAESAIGEYYIASVVAQITYKFGISASYTMERRTGDNKTLEHFMYPLSDNHPSNRDKDSE